MSVIGKRWSAFILLVGLSGGPTEAQAQTEERTFDELVSEALDHYKEEDFEAAIDDFEAAYAMDPRPELVYNIARSHERALHHAEAIAAYQRFIDLPGTTAALRAKALASLTSLLEEQSARERASTAAARPPGPDPEDGGAVAAPLGQPLPPPTDRTLEWVLLGSGAALVGAGAVFGVLALDSESRLEDARNSSASNLDELSGIADEVESRALAADILFGAGALTALAGVVLFLVRGSDDAPISLGPALMDGGSGVAISGTFGRDR